MLSQLAVAGSGVQRPRDREHRLVAAAPPAWRGVGQFWIPRTRPGAQCVRARAGRAQRNKGALLGRLDERARRGDASVHARRHAFVGSWRACPLLGNRRQSCAHCLGGVCSDTSLLNAPWSQTCPRQETQGNPFAERILTDFCSCDSGFGLLTRSALELSTDLSAVLARSEFIVSETLSSGPLWPTLDQYRPEIAEFGQLLAGLGHARPS